MLTLFLRLRNLQIGISIGAGFYNCLSYVV
uniref:Uncharacterized protein n=1 Tax=Arundo donax TaxID=35708 RepID=A0A0A9GAX4_ARUDO